MNHFDATLTVQRAFGGDVDDATTQRMLSALNVAKAEALRSTITRRTVTAHLAANESMVDMPELLEMSMPQILSDVFGERNEAWDWDDFDWLGIEVALLEGDVSNVPEIVDACGVSIGLASKLYDMYAVCGS